jgi:hypothetical protein
MHKKIKFTFLLLTLALVGCKTTGVQKANKTVKAMDKNFAIVKSAPDRITAVTDSLNELIKEGGDMRAEFKAFDKSVNKLISQRDRFRKLKANVDSSKNSFVEAWAERQATITNDELRNRSEERRSEVIARFEEVNALVARAKAELEPWLQEIIDIRTYLESDLNPGGIASIADLIPKISRNAGPVKSKLNELITELDKLRIEMTATKSSKSKNN